MSLKENALQNTLFSLIAGVSYGVGPVIGGYLTAVSFSYTFLFFIFHFLSLQFLTLSPSKGPLALVLWSLNTPLAYRSYPGLLLPSTHPRQSD